MRLANVSRAGQYAFGDYLSRIWCRFTITGMDHRPRAHSVRLLAFACYFPVVALFVLVARRFFDVRLLRFHAYQSLMCLTLVTGLLILGGLFSSLTLWMPAGAFWLDLLIGMVYIALLCGYTGLAGHAAWVAYQGQYTRYPLLTDWVWRCVHPTARRLEPGRKRRARPAVAAASASEAPNSPVMPLRSGIISGLASE
jgi:hypothetical protein